MSAPDDRPCHDCGAEPGDLHAFGCDVERCPECGHQLISCGCFAEVADDDEIPRRMAWSGEWPGLSECREYGLWCLPNPDGPGWLPCSEDEPGATEDLNRLIIECVWDKRRQKWLQRPG